jgi:glycine cleavage system H lipoate-binding protein
MAVLFVVLTFAVFIAVDYILHRKRYQVTLEEEEPAVAPARAVMRPYEPVYVNGVTMLPQLRYHPGHAWTHGEGAAVARVGVDDFAARLLGPVQKIDFPAVGRWIRQGEKAFTVHQNGRSADIISPVEGEVMQVNTALLENPNTVRTDPYGNGWVMVVHSPDLATTLRNLLSGSLAVRWMEDSVDRLRHFFTPVAPAMAQEAGPLGHGLSEGLDEEQWRNLSKEFLLN